MAMRLARNRLNCGLETAAAGIKKQSEGCQVDPEPVSELEAGQARQFKKSLTLDCLCFIPQAPKYGPRDDHESTDSDQDDETLWDWTQAVRSDRAPIPRCDDAGDLGK